MSSIAVTASATGTGTVSLVAPVTNSDRTVTLPDNTGTVVTTGSTAVVAQAMLATNVAGNGPAFSAYASAQSSAITTAVDTKVLFDTETFDTNSNFASSRFTPTVAGYYQINATVRFNGTFTSAGLILFKNGANAGYLESGTANFVTGTSLQYMNGSTDYLELYVFATGSSRAIPNDQKYTTFSGTWIRSL